MSTGNDSSKSDINLSKGKKTFLLEIEEVIKKKKKIMGNNRC